MKEIHTDRSYEETLIRRINELQSRISKLENNPITTTTIYDQTNFPPGVEGQITLANDGYAYKFQGGVWAAIASPDVDDLSHFVKFDTYPQTDTFLRFDVGYFEVGTTATGSDGVSGIYLQADHRIGIVATGQIQIRSFEGIFLLTDIGPGFNNGMIIGGGEIDIWTEEILIGSTLIGGGVTIMHIKNVAGVVEYHIQTGASWVADL